jgi:hypothetical protein
MNIEYFVKLIYHLYVVYDLACSPLLVDILAVDASDSKREYLCSIVGSCLW